QPAAGLSDPRGALVVSRGEGIALEGSAMIPRILVPLDGSETAEAVLPYVRALLPRVEAELVLMRAVNPPAATMNAFFPILTASEESARAYLLSLRDDFVKAGVPTRIITRLEGAIPAILEEAARAEVSLIAMATHGRTGLSHLLLGGVCEGVLRGSRVPV